MKSVALGSSTSPAEVTNVSTHGFWLFIGQRELFVPRGSFMRGGTPGMTFWNSAARQFRRATWIVFFKQSLPL